MSKPLLAAEEEFDPALLNGIPDVDALVVTAPVGETPPAPAEEGRAAPRFHDLFLRAQGEMNELVARELGRIERSLLNVHADLEARLASAQVENDQLRVELARSEERKARYEQAFQRLKELTTTVEDQE